MSSRTMSSLSESLSEKLESTMETFDVRTFLWTIWYGNKV